MIRGFQNTMNENTKEYDMLRQEIMQYLKEYQNLRNMMYLITVTILGFCLKEKDINAYLYLLPLVVILPSYLVYIDYYRDIIKVDAYLILFYENKIDFPIKWESKQIMYGKNKKYIKRKLSKSHRKYPYIFSAIACIILYFLNIDKICIVEILIGIFAVISSSYIFIRYKEPEYDDFVKIWNKVQLEEIKHKITYIEK